VSTTGRVDSWLWAVRVYRTRSAATAAAKAGHVTVNDERAKPAQTVRVGDVVRVRIDGDERILQVARLIAKRVGAPIAAECIVDLTPPKPPREERPMMIVRDRGAGRPTKRDRRAIERLMGERD
jgi:ribosome-associated heat shock protein Hsp15